MKKQLLAAALTIISINLFSQISFTNGTDLLASSGLYGTHPISVADINGDGYDDLVVLDNYKIFFQDPEGGEFTELDLNYDGASSAWGICTGDINNDGYSDVLYGGYFDGLNIVSHSQFIDLYFKTNHGEDDFMVFLQGVNFADLDNDGNLDIFACHDVGPSRIYIGDGLGGFTMNTSIIDTHLNGGGENDAGNYGSLFTDINNDGLIDLYIAKCRQGVSDPTDPRRINILFINNGDGTFSEVAEDWNLDIGEQSWSADFGDIDNDGDMDMLLGNHTGEFVQVYINNGDETFTDITTDAGLSSSFDYHVIQSKFADFDNDGYLDIIIAGSSHIMFAKNNGDNTFEIVEESNVFSTTNSFALGDLNHDGYTDFYSTPGGYGAWGSSGTDSLYLNNGGENNFITFDLEGTISNRDGIGARVIIYGSFGQQMREIRSGESYGIQNTLSAHFGIGLASTIDSAFVHWPSGVIDQLLSTEANQFITVIEGAFPVGINNDLNLDFGISVYPNPASDHINIVFENTTDKQIDLQILNQLGKEVYNESSIRTSMEVELSRFEAGIYIFNFWVNSELVESQKITIK